MSEAPDARPAPPSTRAFLARLGTPLAVALALRVGWWLLVGGVSELVSDCNVYDQGARSFLRGDGFAFENGDPNGYWPPGYSAMLAPFYAAIDGTPTSAHFANLLLGLAFVALSALLTRRLYGDAAGLVAAWIVALYPSLILYVTLVASENLTLPMAAAFGLATLSAAPRLRPLREARDVLLQGALLGLFVLVRATALALPLLTPLGARLAGAGWVRGTLRVVPVVALAMVICIPWGLRNQEIFGKYTVSSFNGGAVFWMGNHDGPPTTSLPAKYQSLPIVEKNRVLREEAMQFIADNPGVFVGRLFTRTWTAIRIETIAVVWNEPGIVARFGAFTVEPFKGFTSLGWWGLLGVFLYGFVRRIRARAFGLTEWWLLAGIAAGSAPFVLFFAQNRYHFPLIPFMVPLAAAEIARWLARRRAAAAEAGAPAPAAP